MCSVSFILGVWIWRRLKMKIKFRSRCCTWWGSSISQPTGWHCPWVTCFLPQEAVRGKTYFGVCSTFQLSPGQSLSRVRLFVTPWIAARPASLSITNSWSPPKPMSIKSMMTSDHLTLCRPLLLLPSIFPSIRVFSNESVLHSRWPKYWSFSFNVRTDLL